APRHKGTKKAGVNDLGLPAFLAPLCLGAFVFNSVQFPLRMAWRETRAATGKFLFVVLSVALGAAALTAVTGFNESVRYTLLREARSLLAGHRSLRGAHSTSRTRAL